MRATWLPIRVKGSSPRSTAHTSIVLPARWISSAATVSASSGATPVCGSKCSAFQCLASTPAVIEPPDTLEMRSSFGSQPSSLSRHSAPR